MYVTNLTNKKLGVNGALNLAPYEVNHYVSDKDLDLVARVVRLEHANMVSVVREAGLTKTGITGKVVKTIGIDEKGLHSAPRSANVKPPVVKPVVTVAPKAEEVKVVEEVKVEAAKEAVETVAPMVEPEPEVAQEEAVKPSAKSKATRTSAKAKAATKATEEASEEQ